ncbi:MAG: hypothetical protein ACYC8T_29790 [Myxococcaceae bacterium]
MKKLVIAALMLASCLAFAGAPTGTAPSKAKPRPAASKVAPAPDPVEASESGASLGGLGTSGSSTAAPTKAVLRGTGTKKAKPAIDTSSAGQ